ncbi:concanavalin A-like lectin/glucanase domain-containing protein [Aspergillus coremiiformis]|uniref:xyloglucan-specific endo-beta-1,4-glucanase n=1 Tax=Aspergillus coremiiformis TaxID=138285 RepID=A0A5N6ZBT5_9EURO|nr:concanavalin A-like lectin/glucanase domain-containing protein [Aspergillus coremiiformis]
MVFRWFLNAGLLALPIAATVGTLMGIEAHRHAAGLPPLFHSDSHNNGRTTRDGISNTRYCDLFNPISPPSKGQLYTLNPNQWGVTEDTSGSLCVNITTIANGSYPTTATAPPFSVTWQFEPGPTRQPVHAFPNIMVDDVLPVALADISQLDFNIHWTYSVGSTPANQTNISQLSSNAVNTNVALDLFFDTDPQTAQNVSLARYEMMVWFAGFGNARPFGYSNGIARTKDVNGTIFNLYTGRNGLGQQVLTWFASNTTERFTGDLYPLISDLFLPYGDVRLSRTDYLGVLSFGTEVFSSSANVTFWMPTLSIDIRKSDTVTVG